jgi:hypothetical protein
MGLRVMGLRVLGCSEPTLDGEQPRVGSLDGEEPRVGLLDDEGFKV